MKKLTFAVTLALALVTVPPVYADKRQQNGDRKGAGSQDTTRVPEPSILMLLGSGLLTIGGLLVVARKRLLNAH